MEDLQAGHAALERMLRAAGVTYRQEDRALVLGYGNELASAPTSVQDRFQELFEAASLGFFHCAAEGLPLVSLGPQRVDFDLSLEANYPGSGAAFRRFATSYWTLRMLEARIARRYSGTGLQQLLCGIEARVARVFFVDPDNDETEPAERAAEQRRLILRSGADIDVEAFLLGNPLLMGNPLAD